MERETLEIDIDADGMVRVTVKGRKGPRCMEIRELFKEFLGPVRTTAQTSEYYEEDNVVRDVVAAKSHVR